MEKCPHCNKSSAALSHPLIHDKAFWVVCDVHPLVEGHILVIPKEHVACMGALGDKEFRQFTQLYERVINFLIAKYGSYAVFEHGVTGQTVFHAHMHFLPFARSVGDVLNSKEGKRRIKGIAELRRIHSEQGRYLFLQLNKRLWSVNPSVGKPRFFRDRLAKALGEPKRGNWKKAEANVNLMMAFKKDILELEKKWKAWHKQPL